MVIAMAIACATTSAAVSIATTKILAAYYFKIVDSYVDEVCKETRRFVKNKMEISEKEWLDLKGEIAVCKRENTAMKAIMKEKEKDEKQLFRALKEYRRETRVVIIIIMLTPVIGEVLMILLKLLLFSL